MGLCANAGWFLSMVRAMSKVSLAKYPNTAHTQYMKYTLIVVISLMFMGCQKDRFTNTSARSWDSRPVSLDSMPNNVIPQAMDNIGILARAYGIASEPTEVYIKKQNDGEWVLTLPNLPQGNETYVYDPVTHEVRFQGCNIAWAYAVYW